MLQGLLSGSVHPDTVPAAEEGMHHTPSCLPRVEGSEESRPHVPSSYTHPSILQTLSADELLLCSEAKLSHTAEAAKSQSHDETTETEISRNQEVSRYNSICFQRTPSQKANVPTAPSCDENPKCLQGLSAEEVIQPAKASGRNYPAILEGLLPWEEN